MSNKSTQYSKKVLIYFDTTTNCDSPSEAVNFKYTFITNISYKLQMLDALITSKTRIKLLLKFFLNSNNRDYLRSLESEFGDSSNSIRQELNKLEAAGLLQSENNGNKKIFNANIKHPLFPEINSILMKFTGLDQLLLLVINRLGDLHEVYLIGDLGRGIDSELIDLVFVGNINREYLNKLIEKAEKHIHKKIRYVFYNVDEFYSKKDKIINDNDLLLWKYS